MRIAARVILERMISRLRCCLLFLMEGDEFLPMKKHIVLFGGWVHGKEY